MLDFLGALAEVLLALELLVVTVLAAALCAGVWFGLRFAHRKSEPAVEKVNEYVTKGRSFQQRALRSIGRPVIVVSGFGIELAATLETLVQRSAGRD